MTDNNKIRLQLFLSGSGACSRRKASSLIKAGMVKVNGIKIYQPAYLVSRIADKILLYNKAITPKGYDYLLVNKPPGVTTTKKDKFAKKTVLDLLPGCFKHLNPVGRLDKDTTGLLLMTNDGQLTYRLTHPSFKINKVYHLRLGNIFKRKDKATLEKGILLEGKKTAPCRIVCLKNKELKITLHEGRKRQIKKMFAALGYKVIKLKRTEEGCLSLGNLACGRWRRLKKDEIEKLIQEKLGKLNNE